MDKPVDLPFDLETFLPYRLAMAAGRVSRDFSERYRSQFGISVAEWRVIANLTQKEAVSVRDIFERVDMDKSKVSRAASRLEKAGYVKKLVNPGDRRLVSLTLTQKGQALAARILPMAIAFQDEVLASLGETAQGLQAGLDRLLENGETDDED